VGTIDYMLIFAI